MTEIVRPYPNLPVYPNERKAKLLNDTLDYLYKGSNCMFDVLTALLGGVVASMVPENKSKEEPMDVALVCAINWFRVMKKSNSNELLTPQMLLSRFQEYYGQDAIGAACEYLTGNVDLDQHQWVDCRVEFAKLATAIKTTEQSLRLDLNCLIQENILQIIDGEINGWDFCSKVFGSGTKEDRGNKVKILSIVVEICKNKNPTSWNELRKLCYSALEIKDFNELYKLYCGDSKGRPDVLIYAFKENKGNCSKDELDNFIKKCENKIKEKSLVIDLPNKVVLKKYIANIVGECRGASWSEMVKNSLTDIVAKNTRNYTYANDRLRESQELKSIDSSGADELNKYFSSPFYKGTKASIFCIGPRHIGPVEKLKEIIFDEPDIEAAIEQYNDAVTDKLKVKPNYDLVKYIISLFDKLSVDQIVDAAKYNASHEKYARKKVHPTIKGNLAYNFGASAMDGYVVPPTCMVDGKFIGENNAIWLSLKLLDGGVWVEHHIPIFNNKFYEEVYSYNPNVKEVTPLRTKRFGHKLNYEPTTEDKHAIKENAIARSKANLKSHSKAHRRVIRSKNSLMPNVIWDMKKCPFSLQRRDGKVFATINFHVSGTSNKENKKWYDPQIGDKFIAYDLNQTAANTYGIIQIVDAKHPGALLYHGRYVIVVETGKITSNVQVTKNGDTIDQLSYYGIEIKNNKKDSLPYTWKKNRKAFITSMNEPESQDAYKKLISNSNIRHLYGFNNRYHKIILKLMKKLGATPEIRKEIIELICGPASIMRLSSLNYISFDAFRSLKSVIHSYFGLICIESNTKEDKKAVDLELFQLLEKVDKKSNNKREEKSKRISDFLLTLAVKNNINCIVGEGELSVSNKGTKKKQNARNIDWCARQVVRRIKDGAKLHGIKFEPIMPHWTSHQDPLEHEKDTTTGKVMKARFIQISPDDVTDIAHVQQIADWMMRRISTILKSKDEEGTAVYYREAMCEFLSNYGLEDLKNDLRLKKISFINFKTILKDRLGENVILYLPMRGGRFYMSTHKVTTDAKLIKYNGQQVWLSDSDEIAAVNVGLTILRPRGERSGASKTPKTARTT